MRWWQMNKIIRKFRFVCGLDVFQGIFWNALRWLYQYTYSLDDEKHFVR